MKILFIVANASRKGGTEIMNNEIKNRRKQ